MLKFKLLMAAKSIEGDIELMRKIRKGQLMPEGCINLSFANQFYALAGKTSQG